MNHNVKLPSTRHKLLAGVGEASALRGSAGVGLGGMKGIGVKAVKRYVEWIVKKTPVQLNPPKRITFYNLSHG